MTTDIAVDLTIERLEPPPDVNTQDPLNPVFHDGRPWIPYSNIVVGAKINIDEADVPASARWSAKIEMVGIDPPPFGRGQPEHEFLFVIDWSVLVPNRSSWWPRWVLIQVDKIFLTAGATSFTRTKLVPSSRLDEDTHEGRFVLRDPDMPRIGRPQSFTAPARDEVAAKLVFQALNEETPDIEPVLSDPVKAYFEKAPTG
jgi:hypothetical protein